MFKNIARALMLSAFVVAGMAMTAAAQNPPTTGKVQIGFDFYVGSKQLPAGEYVIKFVSRDTANGVIQIQQLDGGAQLLVHTFPVTNAMKLESGSVVFNKQGDRQYLSAIQLGDQAYVHQVLKNTPERIAKRESARKVADANSTKASNSGTEE